MRKARAWMLRLAGMFDTKRRERELADELESHLAMHVEDNLRAGMPPEEARRAAVLKLGGIEATKEGYRDRRGVPVTESLAGDARYGVRQLVRHPGFTIVAALTLALGIGPITAIFTLAYAVLFRPLPYHEPDRLVRVYKNESDPLSVPDFVEIRDQSRTCDRLATFTIYSVFNLLGEGDPEAIQGSYVSADLFSTLGVEPLLGRGFLPGEDRQGAAPAVVLNNRLWQQRFGGDPNIVGRQLNLNEQAYTVVGVMPPGFEFPIAPSGTQIWAAATLDLGDPTAVRGNNFLSAVARLGTGVTAEQAEADLQAVLQPQYPNRIRTSVMPLREQLVGDTRTPLLVLLGAIGFVLLIACANVANLVLTRASGRRREIAVRTSLGASQSRLFRQLLTESLLLAAVGGALGLLLAYLSLNLLVGFSPIPIPRLDEVGIDGRVLGFLALVVLLTGVSFGTLSTLRLTETDLREVLKEGATRSTAGLARQRLRRVLVVTEVALSLVLLVGAGLLLRSFVRLQAVDPGFEPEGVLCINVTLPQSRYSENERRVAFVQQVVERLETLAPARSVAAGSYVPWTMGTSYRRFAIEGLPLPEPGKEPFANYFSVSSEYFHTLGIRVVEGRTFTPRDDLRAPGVAVVNETFARRVFPSEPAIGKRIRFYSSRDPQPPWLEIVGVVGDVKQGRLDGEVRPDIYVSQAQTAHSGLTLFVRTDTDPSSLTAAAKSAIQEVDEDLPVAWTTTLDRTLSNSIADRRGLIFLLTIFASLAMVLAAVGVYGVISHSVSQRTHEIGIRMALGAQRSDMLKLVMRQGAALALAGVGIGLGASVLLTRAMSSMLFEVSTTDPVTLAGVPPVLMAVALLACYIPARRATRVDPMVSLRDE